MSLADTVFGKPATTTYATTAGTKPPGFQFANSFFNSLQGLTSGNPFPTYGKSIDPGLSPTLTDLIQRAQGYASSTPPSILQGASGVYGKLMNPHLQNPVTRIFGGAPDYTGRLDPNQKVYGGGNAGSMTMPGSFTGNAGQGGGQGGPSAPPPLPMPGQGAAGQPAPQAQPQGGQPNFAAFLQMLQQMMGQQQQGQGGQ